jgi:hypothetical protein
LNYSEWCSNNHLSSDSVYVINLKALNQKLHQHITDYLAHVSHTISTQLNTSVTKNMALFITDFSQSLDAVRSNLEQSLIARQQNEAVQLLLQHQLKQFIRAVHYIHEDTRLLREDLRMLSSAEKP